MARDMGVPEYWYESLVADGYIRSLKALWELRGLVKDGRVTSENKDRAGRYFRMYLDALKQAAEALPKWEEIRDIRLEHANYTGIPVNVIAELRKQMTQTATRLGIEVP
jgi:hypothetical protein